MMLRAPLQPSCAGPSQSQRLRTFSYATHHSAAVSYTAALSTELRGLGRREARPSPAKLPVCAGDRAQVRGPSAPPGRACAITTLEEIGTFEGQVIVNLYAEERDRVARVAKACLDSGVAERQVKLAEIYGATLANLLRAVFADKELDLTAAQREQLPNVLRRYLGALEATRSLVPAAALEPVSE